MPPCECRRSNRHQGQNRVNLERCAEITTTFPLIARTLFLLRIFSNWNRHDFVLDVYYSFSIRTAAFIRSRSRFIVTNATEYRTSDPCDEFYFVRTIKYVSEVTFKIACDLWIRVACMRVYMCKCVCVMSALKTQRRGCEEEEESIGRQQSNFKVSSHLSVIYKILHIKYCDTMTRDI